MARGFLKGVLKPKEELVYRKTPIAWGVPCDEIGFSKFWIRFVGTAGLMPFDTWIPSEGTYLEKARNDIHNKFLLSKQPYLMMLDSDILFPPSLLKTLLDHAENNKKSLVGGWYKDKKADDHHPCVYDFVEDKEDFSVFRHRKQAGEGLEKVGAMGAGCWLMSREVAEALGENPYGHKIAGGGEDFILCRKLIDLNIPLLVDWNLACAHVGVGFY